MAKKIVKIEYDPYTNHIQFSISTDSGESWHGVADTSELLKYQNQECVFSNCVEDIVSYINQYQNSSVDGLYIQFIGTDEGSSKESSQAPSKPNTQVIRYVPCKRGEFLKPMP